MNSVHHHFLHSPAKQVGQEFLKDKIVGRELVIKETVLGKNEMALSDLPSSGGVIPCTATKKLQALNK